MDIADAGNNLQIGNLILNYNWYWITIKLSIDSFDDSFLIDNYR